MSRIDRLSSGLLEFSWLIFCGFQAQFSTEKQNPNLIVHKDTKASYRGLDRLDAAMESFGWSVADRGSKPRQDSVESILQHLCHLLDWIHSAVDSRHTESSHRCQHLR